MTDEDRLRARFDAVYRQHDRRLLLFAAGQGNSPQDLLQTASARAWSWLLKHSSAPDDLLRSMLFYYVRWSGQDEGRKRKRSPILVPIEQQCEGGKPFEKKDEDAPLPDEAANRPDLAGLVEAAIQRMKNAKMRRLLELLYVDPSPTLQEVAETMGESYANAKKLHERAKNTLKATLLSLAKEMNLATDVPRHES